jgi:hypothetical protein
MNAEIMPGIFSTSGISDVIYAGNDQNRNGP